MKMTRLLAWTIKSLAVFLFAIQPSFATGFSTLDALRSGNYMALQKFYSTLQSRFKKGELSEVQLLDAYKPFYQNQDKYRAQLNAWIDRYPKSSYAYLARGIYNRKLGENRRGTKYINQVPEENITYMEKMYLLAKKDLKRALQLNRNSYLAVLHLLNISQSEGNSEDALRYMQMGNKISPRNMLVRARYLIHLAPRWGGSYAAMEKFIKLEQQQGLADDMVKQLESIKYDDIGFSQLERGNQRLAITNYEKGLTLASSATPWFRKHYLSRSLQVCSLPEYRNKTYCLN